MPPLSPAIPALIEAWEEAQASSQWIEPEPLYPDNWWLIQLEAPQEFEPPLRWAV